MDNLDKINIKNFGTLINNLIIRINSNDDSTKFNPQELALLDTVLTTISDYLLIKHHDKALSFDDFGNIEPCNNVFKTNETIIKIQVLIDSIKDDSYDIFKTLVNEYNSKYYAKILHNIRSIIKQLKIE